MGTPGLSSLDEQAGRRRHWTVDSSLPGRRLAGTRTTAKEEGLEVHGSVGVVLYGYSQGELSEEATKRVLRDLKQDTNLYLSTPLVEHAIELVESDDAGW